MKRDQLPIPSAIPVEAALALYDSADLSLNVESFMGAARDELISDLCDGKQVGWQKLWLRDVLDSEIDRNSAMCVHSLAEMFSGLASVRGDDAADRMTDFQNYINECVTAFVDRNEKLIEDRATLLAEQADEAAELASMED